MQTMNKLLIGALAATALSACTGNTPTSQEAKPVTVKTYSPGTDSQPQFTVSGIVTAENTAIVSTRIMGYVEKVYVKPGDKVSKGQLLVTINNTDIMARKSQAQAALAEAQAAATNAERDYERYGRLYEQNSVSKKELENMELHRTSIRSKVQMAGEALKEVSNMLTYTRITAPFTGVVTQKTIDEGSMASPGAPLLTIEQTGQLNVSISVPEHLIASVKTGEEATVEIKALNRSFTGTISEVSPSATMTGGQYAAKITIPATQMQALKSGMTASVKLHTAQAPPGSRSLTVEKSSIVHREQLTGVYVVSGDNVALLRWIRTGKDLGSRVEALSGISAGDRIVQNVNGELYSGCKVTIE